MSIFFQMSYSAVFVLIALFSALWYIKSKLPVTSPPLPPGPPSFPIVGNLPFLKPDLPIYFQYLAQKYGPLFKLRLGTKLAVVVSSPEVVREILKTHDVVFANHHIPATGLIVMYGGVDIVWSPYGPHWRMMRKLCVHKMLSNATLDSSYGLRRRATRESVKYLAGHGRVGSPVNLGEHIFGTILNVITQMLWGATVVSGERERVATEFRNLVLEVIDLTGQPNISDFFPGLSRFDLQGLCKKVRGLAQRLDQMFDRIIDQRLGMDGDSKSDGEDFLQFLIKVKDEVETTPLSLTHVKALFMDLVLAGTDTSSNTIEFAMAELISKPEIMKRAQRELDEAVGKDKIIEESHTLNLPYLVAIMKEALRLHPPAPILIPRRPSQSTVITGYTIPKDSMVFFNMWAIHRDPSLWENPLEFNPDRFLNKSYGFKGNDYNYLPFGSGRRICAGITMAEKMILYNLATLLHSFDWKVPQGQKLEIEEKFGTGLRLKNSLVAIPMSRLSDPNLYQ